LQRHVEEHPRIAFLSSSSISLIGSTASPLQVRISPLVNGRLDPNGWIRADCDHRSSS
jgi:hypothetical protein